MKKIKHSEKSGVVFTLISALLWGVFPILVNAWSGVMPPLFFAAMLCLFAAMGSIIWMLVLKKTKELRVREAYVPLVMVSLCIVFIPNLLFFIGTAYTSGINSSVLMLSEIIFTLMFTPFFGEKNTTEKYIGSLGILIGAFLVLFNGSFDSINKGDILIICSTITFPIGNFFSKRALYLVSPSVVLAARYTLGGVALLIISLSFETVPQVLHTIHTNFLFLVLVGAILLSASKITFYEGMKRLDISKVISIEMTYPFFSLIVLYMFFDEQISVYQILGIGIMVLGAFYTMKRKSENHEKLKYIPKSKRK